MLSRIARPLLSLRYQAASYFPEQDKPPFWLENLSKPGHQKPVKNINPRPVEHPKLVELPGDEPQPYKPFQYQLPHKLRRKMKKQGRDHVHIDDRVKGADKDTFQVWGCTPQIVGGLKKMYKISQMVDNKPLDDAILQLYFRQAHDPRAYGVNEMLLELRKHCQITYGVTDTSNIWLKSAQAITGRIDKQGFSRHAKTKRGANSRRYSLLQVQLLPHHKPRERLHKVEEHAAHYVHYMPPKDVIINE